MRFRTHLIAISCLFMIGIAYFFYQISPYNLLKLQHYSTRNIELILQQDDELVSAILNLDPLTEFDVDPNTFAQVVLSESFSVADLAEYKALKTQYKDLTLMDIIFLDTTLTQRIVPIFRSLNYFPTDINILIQSDEFLTAIQEQDNDYINTLIHYATLTKAPIETVMTYTNYDQRNRVQNDSEVIRAIEYFNDYLVYELIEKGYTESEVIKLQTLFTVNEIKLIESSGLTPSLFFELLQTPHFELDQLLTYSDILTKNDFATPLYAVQSIRHPYILTPSSFARLPVKHTQRVTVYLNETYQLPPNYRPNNLVKLPEALLETHQKTPIYLQDVASQALTHLIQSGLSEGYSLKVTAGFIQEQTSEHDHQTGLSVDLSLQTLTNEVNFEEWLDKTLSAYGFIACKNIENSQQVYHIRYVGTVAALEMEEKDLTFEQYLLAYEQLD